MRARLGKDCALASSTAGKSLLTVAAGPHAFPIVVSQACRAYIDCVQKRCAQAVQVIIPDIFTTCCRRGSEEDCAGHMGGLEAAR
jgi:hypothetical protein